MIGERDLRESVEQFNRIDPEKITGFSMDMFSADIRWEPAAFRLEDADFGVFQIHEAFTKPIIAKRNEGKDQQIRNGEIYYRYVGRTQTIQYAELQNIIDRRVEQNNRQWLDLMAKIGRAGPQNAAILDTERAVIEKDDKRVLVLDENLAQRIKFTVSRRVNSRKREERRR